MNYLAHLALSGSNEEVMVGNFMGDFAKGRLTHPRFAHLSDDVRKGLALHRLIDHFTDTHPVVLDCRNRLNGVFPRYASVIIDMYFDHFLAKNFEDYYDLPLGDFVKNTYAILPRHDHLYYPAMKPMVESMLKYDWLNNYQHPEGLRRSLGGMAKKNTILAGIEKSYEELFENYTDYYAYFCAFFPELQRECTRFLIDVK